MLSLLQRNIAAVDRRLVLVAPNVSIPDGFSRVVVDPIRHETLLREMQHLRGSVYLQDGAVHRAQLTADGLHRTPEDDRSWHLLMTDADGRVSSCVWYMQHDGAARFDDLRVRHCPPATTHGVREHLRQAIESEMHRARQCGLRYAEVGGWAVARESRCTSEGLLLAFAAYALGRSFGGALGLTTATVRHFSSRILRRLGGSLLEVAGQIVEPYYDPRYECQMELLRFDSRRPSVKYGGLIDLLGSKLTNVPVVVAGLHATAAAHECDMATSPLVAA